MVIIKLRLVSMDRAVNPDALEAVQRINAYAESIADVYEKAGPFHCEEHPEAKPMIEVVAVTEARAKVRQVAFCCQSLSDQVAERLKAGR